MTVDKNDIVAVYRPRVILPLVLLTGITLVVWTTVSGSIRDFAFFLIFWSVCAIPILVRYTRAVIVTKDALVIRLIIGTPLKVPFVGIKRVYWISMTPGAEGPPPACIEFFVGGRLDLCLDVKGEDEIMARLQEAAEDNQNSGFR